MEDFKKDSSSKILPVILSGGIGSRLWPLSRTSFPKQYTNISQKNSYSLLQNTYLRLKNLEKLLLPLIICNEDHRFIVAEQIKELKIKPESIILEPFGRDTAPAITLAALNALKNNNDKILLILSADHEILDQEEFIRSIEEAIYYAENDKLVTFGVAPNKPETGYGYIECFDEIIGSKKVSQIKRFIEKPEKKIAEKLIRNKNIRWNSGIFLFKASTIIREIKILQPEIYKYCKAALEEGLEDLDFLRINEKEFEKCPNISIDKAVMEKTKSGVVFALDAGWSDIGSWQSVWEISEKDDKGNCFIGKTISKNVKNCYFSSKNRLIVGVDLEDLIVVDTIDSLLIINKKSSQFVKEIVSNLKNNNFSEAENNKKVYRPWGSYTSVIEGPTWQVKRLDIKPKASLSLQKHQFRSEHWVVVNGTAKVEIDGEITLLQKNKSIFVPLGSKHRLSNPYDDLLQLIEVQSGTYLGEDDILRFDDIYGRKVNE